MSSEKRKRTLHYKHAKLSQTSKTLQNLLEEHLDNDKSQYYKVKNRQNFLTEDRKAVRFINSHNKHGGTLLLCQLVQFESGLSQLTIEVDDDAGAYPLNALNPKDIRKRMLILELNFWTQFYTLEFLIITLLLLALNAFRARNLKLISIGS